MRRPALLAIALSVIAAACVDDSPEGRARRELSNARSLTTVLCEQTMSAKLRAPGTANYPFGHGAAVQAVGVGRYRLASYVDAENAFGGQVRTHFVCDVEGDGAAPGDYRVVDFALADR